MFTLTGGRRRLHSALASALMVGTLAVAMAPSPSAPFAIALGACGLLVAFAPWTRDGLRAVRRHPEILVIVVLAAIAVAWGLVLVRDARRLSDAFVMTGSLLDTSGAGYGTPAWTIGDLPMWLPVLTLVCAAGGFVLLCDAARVFVGVARPPSSVWRVITAAPSSAGRIAIRTVPGIALIGTAAFGVATIFDRRFPDSAFGELFGILAGLGLAALLAGVPLAVGVMMRFDFDKESRARERERQRFAAHLHDSVLQTLALIQRQAGDADVVSKLARHQEHALRAWMAGEVDLGAATITGATQEMVNGVEDEYGLTVELTAIGDAKLDSRAEEMIAAAREALRNVARHAPGAPVNVFLDIEAGRVELFIRDSGPGFSLADVPAERRGLRDAVIGRMHSAGGTAAVDSAPGEGTEVSLVLPRHGRTA